MAFRLARHGNRLACSAPGRVCSSSPVMAAAAAGRCRSKCRAAPSADAAPSQQAAHAQEQQAKFSQAEVVAEFIQPLPADIQQRLQTIVSLLPGLSSSSRVIDVGSGTGCLLPHLQARGVRDILAVDLSEPMLQQLRGSFPAPSSCGNDPGVRTWAGDFLQLPAYLGPVTAITMNAVFGNLFSPHEALLKAAMLLQPGGHLLVSHPLGRAWHGQLHREQPQMVPHPLPDRQQWGALTAALPLQLLELVDEPDCYAALLQVPEGYRFPSAPLVMDSRVVTGFGRGSRQLGVPTANMDPAPLAQQLQGLPQGVYFGWAQLEAPPGWPAADSGVHKMVMNVGRRPTVNLGDEAATVEVHILHRFSREEFYGCRLVVVAAGFVRPEVRFSGLPQLLGRIRTDIGIARSLLDEPAAAALRSHESFRQQ